MADEPARKVPESVRRVLEAVLRRALAQCDRLGVDWEDFYRAVVAEEELDPTAGQEEIYERAFRRLESMRN